MQEGHLRPNLRLPSHAISEHPISLGLPNISRPLHGSSNPIFTVLSQHAFYPKLRTRDAPSSLSTPLATP
jgi:hypothetical protein